MPAVPICTPVSLPPAHMARAAEQAVAVNPVNRPALPPGLVVSPPHLALLTTKYWGAAGVHLTVGFLERTAPSLREHIIGHMNAWGLYANVRFLLADTDPQVRITRDGEGYWSYLGTDVLSIPAGQPTMCLEGFTAATTESEFVRVVRHETGHCLGFPHEHLRRELVARLDVAKTLAYFERTQGWDEQTVRAQVLTPLSDAQLWYDSPADVDSIMAYSLPAEVTVDGRPVVGGVDIDANDARVAGRIYPREGGRWRT